MKKHEVKTLINDLLSLGNEDNPIDLMANPEDIEVDLLKKTINYPLRDSLYEFYERKMEWFNKRIDALGGRPFFQIAKIKVSGKVEKVEIVFMNDTFLGEFKYRPMGIPGLLNSGKKLKHHIKKISSNEKGD